MACLVSARGLLRYGQRYRRLFSWKRVWNFFKVAGSLGLSQWSGRPLVWGHPFMLMIEPTNCCNLKCPLCPSGSGAMTRARGTMRLEDFKNLVDQVHEQVFMMMLWNQGEPYLNPRFNEMVRYAHQRRIFTFASTNGHFIRTAQAAREIVESGLDELIFSLDGVTQETYEQYRVGGDLAQVLAGIRRLQQAKEELASTTPLINLQFIVMKHNEAEIASAEALAGELKADKFLVKTAQLYSPKEAEDFLPKAGEYRRYEPGKIGELVVKGQPVRGCKALWYSAMVNWDGRLAPCCFDKNIDFEMGQVFAGNSLAELWQGPKYRNFRRRILADRRSVKMCTNCSEGYRGMFSLVKELRG